MRDYRVDVGSIELQIREYERDAQTIIFLHFGGGNLMTWQRVAPHFQDKYRLILVDLRGHGRSDKPQTGNHIEPMAADVVGMMEQLGLDRAHFVGSSLGAEVALCLAAHHPEKVISLVCEGALNSEYGPYGVWEGSEAEFRSHVAEQVAAIRSRSRPVFPSVEAFVAARKEVFEKEGYWNPYFQAFTEYDACEISPGHFARSLEPSAMAEYMEHYFEYRFEDYYRQVQCPVLMLPAEDDVRDERTRAAMQGLSKLAGQAKIVEVPGWMHAYGWLLNPDETIKMVAAFLAEVGG